LRWGLQPQKAPAFTLPLGAMATKEAGDKMLDMTLDDMIEKTGKKKGKGRGKSGKSKPDKKPESEKTETPAAAKPKAADTKDERMLDMSLDELIKTPAQVSKKKGKGKGKSKGERPDLDQPLRTSKKVVSLQQKGKSGGKESGKGRKGGDSWGSGGKGGKGKDKAESNYWAGFMDAKSRGKGKYYEEDFYPRRDPRKGGGKGYDDFEYDDYYDRMPPPGRAPPHREDHDDYYRGGRDRYEDERERSPPSRPPPPARREAAPRRMASPPPRAAPRDRYEEPAPRGYDRHDAGVGRAPAAGHGYGGSKRARESAADDVGPAASRRNNSTGQKRVKVTNIPPNLSSRDIREAFENETGEIIRCEMDKEGTCWIDYKHRNHAVKAVDTFDLGELNNRTIGVTLVD